MEIRVAELADIDDVFALHKKYHVDSVQAEDKPDGFVTTAFTREQMVELVSQERGLFVAKYEGQVVAYLMAASWQYWSAWPLFAHMIEQLPQFSFAGQQLTVENSYQYGPVCVDKAMRGQGVLEQLFSFALQSMTPRFSFLVTFINKINPRSYAAHTKKLGLTVLHEFDFNNNHYYWLTCSTNQ